MTACEMRIMDWSSDVGAADLANDVRIVRGFILSGSVLSAGPVLGRKFLVDVVREPPQLVLLGRQDGLIAQLRLAGCQQLLQVRLDPPSAQPADEIGRAHV